MGLKSPYLAEWTYFRLGFVPRGAIVAVASIMLIEASIMPIQSIDAGRTWVTFGYGVNWINANVMGWSGTYNAYRLHQYHDEPLLHGIGTMNMTGT